MSLPLKRFLLVLSEDIRWFFDQKWYKILGIFALGLAIVFLIASYLNLFCLVSLRYFEFSLWATMFLMVCHWGILIWFFNTYHKAYSNAKSVVERHYEEKAK